MNWIRSTSEKTYQYYQITITQNSPPEISSEYNKFSFLFQKEELEYVLLKYQKQNHKIKFRKKYKIYPILAERSEILRKYIDKNVIKDFIRKSILPAGYPILWVPKKDGTLKLYVDYLLLNNITVKNSYPLLLISEQTVRSLVVYETRYNRSLYENQD